MKKDYIIPKDYIIILRRGGSCLMAGSDKDAPVDPTQTQDDSDAL